jgi:hypothetical protein
MGPPRLPRPDHPYLYEYEFILPIRLYITTSFIFGKISTEKPSACPRRLSPPLRKLPELKISETVATSLFTMC